MIKKAIILFTAFTETKCKVLLLVAILMLSGLSVKQACAFQILVNGDAETGDITGWTNDGVNNFGATSSLFAGYGTITPHSGTYFFDPGTGTSASMYQEGLFSVSPLIDLINPVFTLSGWFQTELPVTDFGDVTLSILDNLDSVLATVSITGMMTDRLVWDSFSIEISTVEVVGTMDHWRVDIDGIKEVGFGGRINVFFDDLELNVVEGGEPIPEPATILLLGSGLVGLLVMRRYVRAEKPKQLKEVVT